MHLFYSLPFCPLLSHSLSPVTIISFREWYIFTKFSGKFFLLFFLCHLFRLHNTISCYLRAAVENRYSNLHSWHISSSTESVCATEHHRLPCDESPFWQDPSFQIFTKPESFKLVSSLPSISRMMPSLQVFFWWSYKETEPFHFQGSCSGCVQRVSYKQIPMFAETDWIWWVPDKTQRTLPGEFFSWRNGQRHFLVQHCSHDDNLFRNGRSLNNHCLPGHCRKRQILLVTHTICCCLWFLQVSQRPLLPFFVTNLNKATKKEIVW